MASLQLFVTESDLEEIIREFSIKHGLEGCFQIAGKYHPFVPAVKPSALHSKMDRIVKIYLFPKEERPASFTEENVQPKFQGWFDIVPGKFVTKEGVKILTMSVIQGENRKGLKIKP